MTNRLAMNTCPEFSLSQKPPIGSGKPSQVKLGYVVVSPWAGPERTSNYL